MSFLLEQDKGAAPPHGVGFKMWSIYYHRIRVCWQKSPRCARKLGERVEVQGPGKLEC